MWKVTKVSAGMAQLTYAGRFSVSIPCDNFAPIASRVTIDRLPLPKKRKDPFPALGDLTLQVAAERVRSMEEPATMRDVSFSDRRLRDR